MGRKGKETSIELRKLVISLYESGKSLMEVSEIVKRPRSTVQYIVKKYKNDHTIENKPRNLNRKKLNSREERFIVRQVKLDPKISAPKIVKKLKIRMNKTVSADTIRRTLKRYGFFNRIARRKAFANKINRIKRINFAKKYLSKDENFWNRVIFADESKFNISKWDGRTRIWREKNTSLNPKNMLPTLKHGGGSLMLWGCFSSTGTGNLHFIEGIMDTKKYIDILKQNLPSSAEKLGIRNNFIFYQDNDPKHKALNSRLWLLYNCPKVLETPPQSPDINPIENLWSKLKSGLTNYEIKNITDLKTALQKEWENISPDYAKKLVNSMQDRLRQVIRQKGYPTKY